MTSAIDTRADSHVSTALARLAAALMLVSAAISAYWLAGGTGLLGTVGGAIARWGRDGGVGVRLALAAVVALKLLAAWLPPRAVRSRAGTTVRRLAWLEAVILTGYGAVTTIPELALEARVLHPPADTDWQALNGHAYLWDPWFLATGLLVWAALHQTRRRRVRSHRRRDSERLGTGSRSTA